jgi:hypothetical protein
MVSTPPVSSIMYAFPVELLLAALAILVIFFFAKDGSSKRDKKE